MGSLIEGGESPEKRLQENRLKELVLRDLAEIHDVKYETLLEEYVNHFAYDWTHNPLTQGAFAFFGPGEFSTVYGSLTVPAAEGRLHFAGEALSVRHAWVVGALDSAWRAVKEVLHCSYPDKLREFEEKWGKNEEWEPSVTPKTLPGEPTPYPGQARDLIIQHMLSRKPELFMSRRA